MGENENSGWERPEIAGALPEGGPGRLLRQIAAAAGAFAAVLIAAVFIAVAAVPVSAAGTSGGGGFTVANVLSSIKMFYGCGVLEGMNGTQYDSSVIDKAGAVVDKEGQAGYLSVKDIQAFAVYSADDNSLTFYNQDISEVTVGGTFNGKTVTALYTGIEEELYLSDDVVPWCSYTADIKKVDVVSEVSPSSLAYWFYGFVACDEWNGLEDIDVSGAASLQNAFTGCSGLTSLTGLENWDVSNITSMENTFLSCSSLDDISALTDWDVSGMTTLFGTFAACSSLTDVSALKNWDVSSVTTMSNMFASCSSLTSIGTLSNWNVNGVTTLTCMFMACSNLTDIDLSGWDTSSVKDMSSMFISCSSLQTIYVRSGWNTDAVTSSTGMFTGCNSLVGGSGTAYSSSNTDATYARIDGGPSSSTPGYLTEKTAFAVYSEDDNSLVFYNRNIVGVEEGGTFNGKTVTALYTGIEEVSYSGFSRVDWSSYRTSIEKVEIADEIAPSDLEFWFYGFTACDTWIGLEDIDTSGVTSLQRTFYNCSSLTTADLSGWDTSSVTSMYYTFYGCTSLQTIYVGSGWSTDAVTSSTSTFYNCTSLVGGAGTECDGSTNIDATYARIDGGPDSDTPGYLTDIADKQ